LIHKKALGYLLSIVIILGILGFSNAHAQAGTDPIKIYPDVQIGAERYNGVFSDFYSSWFSVDGADVPVQPAGQLNASDESGLGWEDLKTAVKFNITDISGLTISSAKLKIKILKVWSTPTIDIYASTTADDDLTYDSANFPASGFVKLASQTISASDEGQWVEFDLKDAIETHGDNYFSIILTAPTEGTGDMVNSAILSYSYSNDASDRPYLEVASVPGPKMEVYGNDLIPNGDTTPTLGKRTDLGEATPQTPGLKWITIMNTGTANLNLTGNPKVFISGANSTPSTEFTVYTGNPSQVATSPVAPGGQTGFAIQFSPSLAGLRTATVSIANDDPNNNPYTFKVQGTGKAISAINIKGNGNSIANGDVTPSTTDDTDFGSTDVSIGTVVKTFTIENKGLAALNLTGTPKVVIGGTNGSDFAVTVDPVTPIAMAGTTTFQITFNPSGTGLRTATISIASDDSSKNLYTLSIQGTGTSAPVINAEGGINASGATLITTQNTRMVLYYYGAKRIDGQIVGPDESGSPRSTTGYTMFKFIPAQSDTYTISFQSDNAIDGDTRAWLYGSADIQDNNYLAENDDQNATEYDFKVQYSLEAGKTYYLKMDGCFGDWTGTLNIDKPLLSQLPNTGPTFVGANTSLTVNQDASATDIKGLLHVSDADAGQTLTWTQSVVPSHGTLNFSSATAASGSTDVTPGGTITYTPNAGYSGSDSFTVEVSDGTSTATREISVTVNAAHEVPGWNQLSNDISGGQIYALDVYESSGDVYAAYVTKTDTQYYLHVKHLVNGQWNLNGTEAVPITKNSQGNFEIVLNVDNNIPYVAYPYQSGGSVKGMRVDRFTNGSWEQYGGNIDVPGLNGVINCQLVFANGTAYAAYLEPYTSGATETTEIVVRKYNNGWVSAGSITGITGGVTENNFSEFSLTNDGGTLYATYHGTYQIGGNVSPLAYLKKLEGDTWTKVCNLQSVFPLQSKLITKNGTLYHLDNSEYPVIFKYNPVPNNWTAIGGKTIRDGEAYSWDYQVDIKASDEMYVAYSGFDESDKSDSEYGSKSSGNVSKYNGSAWTVIDESFVNQVGLYDFFVLNGNVYVLFTDETNEASGLKYYKYVPASSGYTVTYNANSATSGSVPTDGTSYNSGATVTVANNTGNLARAGYTFAGWNTNPDGTGTTYTAGTGTLTITANTILYARWTAALAAVPTAQATNLYFSNTAANDIKLHFTASASATNYLVVRKTGSAPTFVPVNGTSYTIGAQGTDQIISVGTETALTDSTAAAETEYYYTIYAFNGSGASTNYLTSSPLKGQVKLFAGATDVSADRTTSVSASESVSAGFPGVGVTVTFPNGTTGTNLKAYKYTTGAGANFYGLPSNGRAKKLYYEVTSSTINPGTYTIILDFSSLTGVNWNTFKMMKRDTYTSEWQVIGEDVGTIVDRATDGVAGKFTISGLTNFSGFAGFEPAVIHTVTSQDDSGAGTLRQMLADAGEGDTIIFNPTTMGSNTITLSSPLVINKSVNIIGSNGGIVLDGNHTCRVMTLDNSANSSNDKLNARLENIRIQNGNDLDNYAGGIYATYFNTWLSLVNCIVADNQAQGINTDGYGGVGGITVENSGAYLFILNSTIAGNQGAVSDGGAGGIYAGGVVHIYNSIVYGNSGEANNAYYDANNSEAHSYNTLYGDAIYHETDNPLGVKIFAGTGNLFATDPRFVGSSINSSNPYMIYGISPGADTGSDSYINIANDARGTGFARKLNKTDGSVGTVDMGAYEYKYGVDYYAPVSFDAQGGTDVATQAAIYNGKITAPTAPTKNDFIFSGWYKEAACTNEWVFATDTVTAERTLYAKWINATCTITGNAGVGGATLSYTDVTAKTATADGTGAYSFTVSYNWSGTVTPSKTGYVFSAGKQYSNVTTNQTDQNYIATALTYTISELTDQTMTTLVAGYASGTQETKTITITRTGTGDLTNVVAALSGTNPESFSIPVPGASTLNATTTFTSFTVKANDGLAAGTYTATVTVSADNMTNVSFTVTQVVKAVQANIAYDNVTKTYGDGSFTYTATGGSGTGAFSYTSSDTSVAIIDSATGSVTIIKAGPTTLTATKAGDASYASASQNCTLTINKAVLTATVEDNSKTYGQDNPAFPVTVTGFVNGETAANAAGYTAPTASSTATATTGVGTAAITISGGAANNYTFNIADTGTLTINKAVLTATVEDNSKTYGQDNPAFPVTVSGFVNGETAATAAGYTAPTAGTTATAATGAGTAAITISGGAASNYTFNITDTGTLTINKAVLTATVEDNSKTYGQDNPAFPVTVTGFVNGETAANAAGYTAPTASSTATATTGVGTAAITISGGAANNYTFNIADTGILTINKKALTATATANTKTYDGTTTATGTISLAGIVGTDGVTASGTFTFTDANAVSGKTVNVTEITLGGAKAGNYTVNASTTATANIDKATLTATVADNSKTYGDANPDFLVTVTGFVNGETAATAAGYTAPTASSTATATTGVGTAAITISGGAASNYTFDISDTGTLTINQKALTATGTANAKTHDGTTTATGTISLAVIVGSDDVTATGTFTFVDANVGENITVNVTDITLAGTSAGNYTVNTETTTTANINRRNSGSSQPPQTGVQILVNNKVETAATATTTTVENKTVTTVVLNDKQIEGKLNSEGNNSTVIIPVNNTSDVVVGQLNGQTVKNMETKEAILEIKTETITYTLPASQINIDNVSTQIGEQVELKDIKVNVSIAAPPQETAKIVEDTANKNSYQVVVKPVDFEITCTSGNKTVDVNRFNGYVERTVAIPDGIDPSKITTGIVLNTDGTFSHVPTSIMVIDGKYYAKINSLTNSTYSVIYSPKTFKDLETHWAKDDINDMASRLVINGVGGGNFEPDRDITRAEFSMIVVKALGLMRPGTGKDSFNDVTKDAWYYDAVSIAYEYGIIAGYDDGKFGAMNKITREQAMTIIARAMKITGLKVEFKVGEAEKLLAEFSDSADAAEWAKESMAACVKTGTVTGKNEKIIAPKDEITRAEVSVIVRRLLQKSNLI